MKKLSKQVSLLLCCAIIAASSLSACSSTDEPSQTTPTNTSSAADTNQAENTSNNDVAPEDSKITDGYYTASIAGMPCYCHFSEDGTYYASGFDGGMTDAGTYEVTDKAIEYYAELDDPTQMGGGANVIESSKTTSKQAVILTSYKDGSVQEIAFDNDKLCDFTFMGQSEHATFDHDAAYSYVADDMETPIAILTLYNGNSDSTLTLYHNKSYRDYTGLVGGNGTWEQTDIGYTLNKDGTEITLTLKDGGASYVSGDTSAELTNTVVIAGSVEFVSDSVHIDGILGMEDGADGIIRVTAAEGVAIASLDLPTLGQTGVELDIGTYEEDLSGMFPAYAFSFEKLGEIAAEPDYASATESSIVLNLALKADGSSTFVLLGNDMNLIFDAVAKYTYTIGGEASGEAINSEIEAVAVSGITGFEGASDAKMNLVMNSDGTVTLTCDLLGQTGLELDKGTYTVVAEGLPEYTVTLDKLGEFKSTMDTEVTPTETSVGLMVTITADGNAKFLEEMVPDGAELTFEAVFRFVHNV